MEYKEVKLIGKDEDGTYLGQIEEIGKGHEEYKLLRHTFKKTPDSLFIKNRKPFAWIFSIFTGYRQVGIFNVERPHNYNEGDLIIAEIKNNKIVNIFKE